MRLFEGTEFDVPPRCDRCGALEEECTCPPPPPVLIPPSEQTAIVSSEKRKRGKRVTLVQGLPEEGNDLCSLLTQLKDFCGAGGTLKNGVIEIQGDQVAAIVKKLKEIGFSVQQR